METKHTKEYATELAKDYKVNQGAYSKEWSNGFISGYMTAIEETNAEGLLEALEAAKMLNLHFYEEGTIGHRVYIQITNAINKATK